MNEFDQIGLVVLFFLFPALISFSLRVVFKVKTFIIIIMAILLFIAGYFSYIVLSMSAMFMILGLLLASYYKEKNDVNVALGEEVKE